MKSALPIKFRKKFSYSQKTPTFISNSVSCIDEIARWVLDYHGIVYHDERHAPGLYIRPVNKWAKQKGLWNNPVYVSSDALLYTSNSIVSYFDERSIPEKKLIPDDESLNNRVLELHNKWMKELAGPLSELVYSLLLPHRKYALALFTRGVPRKERVVFKIGYPLLRKALSKGLNLTGDSNDNRINKIKSLFTEVDQMLGDGREYLTGSKLTLADISFASIAAPLILPDQFGGEITRMAEIPPKLRTIILELRDTRAGQFVVRLYQQDRPVIRDRNEILQDPGFLSNLNSKIFGALFGPGFRTWLFSFLQRRLPLLKVPLTNLVVVNKHALVTELLERDEDFTIEEINSKKMSALNDAFFLGMDRMNPQFDRERNLVREASKREDLLLIRDFVKKEALYMTDLAKPYGKLDVVTSVNRVVMTRLVDRYFGVPSPTEAQMKEWLRIIFWDLFLNLSDDEKIHHKARRAANQLKPWISQLIIDRKSKLDRGMDLEDNLLNRLINLQKENPWFDDDAIRRNITGIITGALETTNKSVVLVLDELFRRPEQLSKVIEIALGDGEDPNAMYGFVSESLRFNPHQPIVLRFCQTKQQLGVNGKKYTIPAKKRIFACTSAAMFDPETFPEPKKFDPRRDSRYMNYGYALHECYGKYINGVTIPELVSAILRLPNVRRAKGAPGKGTGLNEGPFPNNFVVEFD